MKRVELIEFLKGYSIFTIIILHYLQVVNLPPPFDKMILFGGTGVHLFVLLSGFGLFLSYIKKPISYPQFLKKRISKIYIPYILIILISATVSIFIPIFNNSTYAILGHVFLYKMFIESIIGSYGYQLWFISLIFQFYLLFYIIVFFKNKLSNSYFLLLSLAISLLWSVLVYILGKECLRVWSSFFLQYLWEFCLGMVLAYLFQNNELKYKFKLYQYFLIGIMATSLFGILALKGGSVGELFNDIPALVGFSSLAILVYYLKITYINKFFIFTGNISFSVYLSHILVLKTISFFLIDIPISIYVILIISLITCYVFSIYYQKVTGQIYKLLKI